MKFDTAIIDADSLLYLATTIYQEPVYKISTSDERISQLVFKSKDYAQAYIEKKLKDDKEAKAITSFKLTGTLQDAIGSYESRIEEIKKEVNSDNYVVFVGNSEKNFRYESATIAPYKGNRVNQKPLLLLDLRNYLIEKSLALEAPLGFEADDAVIALSHKLINKMNQVVVLCGVDKDLLQYPMMHYNYNKKEFFSVSKLEALANLYCQMMTGDTVDNIKGLFGVGASSVHIKHIKNHKNEKQMFLYVYEQYKKRFNNYAKQFFIENFNLLYMCQELTINEGEIIANRLFNQWIGTDE